MKNSVSLSRHSLTMREFWKYDHLSIAEIEDEIGALDKEVRYFSTIEKFLKADEVQKEINFLKEIAKKKALEDLKKKNKQTVKDIEYTCRTNKMDVCHAWSRKIEKLRAEMNAGISKIDRYYKFKQQGVLQTFAEKEAVKTVRPSPVIMDINYLMPQLIDRKMFSDANALKLARKNEQRRLSELHFREQQKRFELKLKELEKKRSFEKLRFKTRLQEKIEEMHKERSNEITQFKKFCEVKKVKACHERVKNFENFQKKISPATFTTIKEEIKRYGDTLRTWSNFSKASLRKTLAF